MKFRVICYVCDENINFNHRHIFYAEDKSILSSFIQGFELAIKAYQKDYKVTSTPIEVVEEDE